MIEVLDDIYIYSIQHVSVTADTNPTCVRKLLTVTNVKYYLKEPNLCTIIVKDAHQTDWYCLVNAATQGFPREGKHKRHCLFSTSVNDSVQCFIQAS